MGCQASTLNDAPARENLSNVALAFSFDAFMPFCMLRSNDLCMMCICLLMLCCMFCDFESVLLWSRFAHLQQLSVSYVVLRRLNCLAVTGPLASTLDP